MAFPRSLRIAMPIAGLSALLCSTLAPAYAAPTPTPKTPPPAPTPSAAPSKIASAKRVVTENKTALTRVPLSTAAPAPSGGLTKVEARAERQAGTVVSSLGQQDTEDFSLVGVTWAAGATHAQAEVRTRTGGQWTDWTLLPEVHKSDNNAREGTEALYVGQSNGIDVRVVSQDGQTPADMKLTLVQPASLAADQQPAITRAAGQPGIISRGAWGARGPNGCSGPDSTVRATVMHHTEGSNNYSASQSAGIVRGIQAYHMDDNGWCDIGYNFLVDRYGQIFEGRYGGINTPVHGAHAQTWNTNTAGVSLMGSYTSSTPPGAQWDAAVRLVAWKMSSYYRSPWGRLSIGGINSDVISGHRQVVNTDCPGDAFYNQLGSFRSAVANAMGDIKTPIYNRWQQLGGEGGAPGAPYNGEAATGGGRTTHFRNYDIYSSGSTPTVFTRGNIRDHYRRIGEGAGPLGLPTTDEVCGLKGGGCYNNFQGGAILWSPATGAHLNKGAIRTKYAELGYENGRLGYPISDEVCGLKDGGCYQDFQGGAILWSPATGAHANWGMIRTKYADKGFENGRLGYPTSDEVCGLVNGGCYQNFQGGAILWSPATGAHSSWGDIRGKFLSMQAERGRTGYPIGDEVCGIRDGGCYQDFQVGAILWSPATGARYNWGQVRAKYAELGYEKSRLGYPTNDATCSAGTGPCTEAFQGGTISWTSGGGAVVTYR